MASAVTTVDERAHELSHRWPQFLPDGRHFLFLAFSTILNGPAAVHGLYVGSLDSPRTQLLQRTTSRTTYVAPGYLLFVRDGVLFAEAFDAKQQAIAGDPFVLVEQIQHYLNTASTVVSASDNGVLAYETASPPAVSELAWFDRTGRFIERVPLPAGEYEDPRLSPKGDMIVMNRQDPQTGISNIWLQGPSPSTLIRFTFTPSFDHYPSWSPDGTRIVFDSNRSGPADIFVKSVAGGSEELLLPHSSQGKQPTDWSPDGRFVVYQQLDPKTKWDLWMLPLAGDQKPEPVLRTESNEMNGQLSPDGRWMAYASDELGRWEVYVTGFPHPSGKWQVSSGGGSQPRWRRDGKELFYLGADRKLMVAEIRAGRDFAAGPAIPLFESHARYTGDVVYDVAPDGQRLLVNVATIGPANPITVVLNWQEELKQRVPTR
jgi:hypothetical protein